MKESGADRRQKCVQLPQNLISESFSFFVWRRSSMIQNIITKWKKVQKCGTRSVEVGECATPGINLRMFRNFLVFRLKKGLYSFDETKSDNKECTFPLLFIGTQTHSTVSYLSLNWCSLWQHQVHLYGFQKMASGNVSVSCDIWNFVGCIMQHAWVALSLLHFIVCLLHLVFSLFVFCCIFCLLRSYVKLLRGADRYNDVKKYKLEWEKILHYIYRLWGWTTYITAQCAATALKLAKQTLAPFPALNFTFAFLTLSIRISLSET